MDNGFFTKVYQLVEKIPKGQVATYSQIARILEHPHNARVVGWAMNKAPQGLPCHRVVKKSGELAPNFLNQRTLLEQEGVVFDKKGRVVLTSCNWNF
ncbi:MGMT family protein [Virgibacillus sp. M23]|uniref:MGMT family protein n=1 Tax=Virgibacillus sp. M23 TaxID=3079030 RepID=UPI002A908EA2|nr:MGMT family protein [Virgibacillus sp. M23]MDY7046164.1 MGMT family protein [Virgibacillus sp. M23]